MPTNLPSCQLDICTLPHPLTVRPAGFLAPPPFRATAPAPMLLGCRMAPGRDWSDGSSPGGWLHRACSGGINPRPARTYCPAASTECANCCSGQDESSRQLVAACGVCGGGGSRAAGCLAAGLLPAGRPCQADAPAGVGPLGSQHVAAGQGQGNALPAPVWGYRARVTAPAISLYHASACTMHMLMCLTFHELLLHVERMPTKDKKGNTLRTEDRKGDAEQKWRCGSDADRMGANKNYTWGHKSESQLAGVGAAE